MEGRVSMSEKELYRLQELQKAHEKRQTLIQAAENLGLSLRQVKRLSKRIKEEGPGGIISRKVGKPSNHQLARGLGELVMGIIVERYSDFGPTLAHEYLVEKHPVSLSVSSVRNLMIREGVWATKSRRKKKVFQLRPRRPREGELIQVDGSDEHWFEDRGPRCSLLSYVDDATSKIQLLRLVKSENTLDYLDATREYVEKHGRPEAIYPDKHSVFRVNKEGALGGTGITQFDRAMRELDIKVICANTPQAKGRVERRHRDLQDRLIKAMRLEKIRTLEEANRFLPSFIEDFNKRFAKPPQDPNNAHRPVLATHDLDTIFCLKTQRRLSKNLTLQYNGVIYQIITVRPSYAMKGAVVQVMESLDGRIKIEYRGQFLSSVAYHQIQARVEVVSGKEIEEHLKRRQPYRPPQHHPWKRWRPGFSRRKAVMV